MNRKHSIIRAAFAGLLVLIASLVAGVAVAATPAWTQLTPGSGPVARIQSTAVYAAASNSMIVFGGGGASGLLDDVWVLSHADGSGGTPVWTQLNPGSGPDARAQHTAVYAPASNSMTVFGGCTLTKGCAVSEIWVLSHADGSGGTPAWTQLNPGSGPYARLGHTAVYAPASNSMIVFGGYNGNYLNDVWVLSHADGTGGTPAWTQLNPGSGPSRRLYSTAVYVPASNSMIVFGGVSCTTSLCGYLNEDVWVLSHADGTGGTPAWTQLNPGSGPGAREYHTAVYDPASNSMIVFGGCFAGPCGSNDISNTVWVLSHADGNGGIPAWTQLNPGSGPTARLLHTSVYAQAGNSMIMFGGYSCTSSCQYANDVWVLSDASGPPPAPVDTPVAIDIRPNLAVNTISLSNGTNVPVAILSSASFNALTDVNRTSLTFGHAGTEASLIGCNTRGQDVNADGRLDLVCHFNGTLGGFVMGDTTGNLHGTSNSGGALTGSDSVVIIQ